MSLRAPRPPQVSRSNGNVSDGAAATQIVARRRGRPGPGAVVGGFLVAAAAVIVFAVALSAAGGSSRSYVVAARSLPAGTVIGPGDMTMARMGLDTANRATAFGAGGQVVGRALTVPVQPGELIEAPMLSAPAGSMRRPVSIPVDATSLTALAAGESVDVLSTPSASGATGTAAPSAVSVVMRGATLWSVGRADSGLLSAGNGGTVVVTLGVSDLAEAEQLVAAAHAGTVELVQATPADGSGLGPGGAAGS